MHCLSISWRLREEGLGRRCRPIPTSLVPVETARCARRECIRAQHGLCSRLRGACRDSPLTIIQTITSQIKYLQDCKACGSSLGDRKLFSRISRYPSFTSEPFCTTSPVSGSCMDQGFRERRRPKVGRRPSRRSGKISDSADGSHWFSELGTTRGRGSREGAFSRHADCPRS